MSDPGKVEAWSKSYVYKKYVPSTKSVAFSLQSFCRVVSMNHNCVILLAAKCLNTRKTPTDMAVFEKQKREFLNFWSVCPSVRLSFSIHSFDDSIHYLPLASLPMMRRTRSS